MGNNAAEKGGFRKAMIVRGIQTPGRGDGEKRSGEEERRARSADWGSQRHVIVIAASDEVTASSYPGLGGELDEFLLEFNNYPRDPVVGQGGDATQISRRATTTF